MKHLQDLLRKGAELLSSNAEPLSLRGQCAAADCSHALAASIKAALNAPASTMRDALGELLAVTHLLAPVGLNGLGDTVIWSAYRSAGLHAAAEQWTSLTNHLRETQCRLANLSRVAPPAPEFSRWTVHQVTNDGDLFAIVDLKAPDDEQIAHVASESDADTIVETRTLFGKLVGELSNAVDVMEALKLNPVSARDVLQEAHSLVMIDTLAKSGIKVLQSDLKGWYYEDDDSSVASDDFVTRLEAAQAAMTYLTQRDQDDTAPENPAP